MKLKEDGRKNDHNLPIIILTGKKEENQEEVISLVVIGFVFVGWLVVVVLYCEWLNRKKCVEEE